MPYLLHPDLLKEIASAVATSFLCHQCFPFNWTIRWQQTLGDPWHLPPGIEALQSLLLSVSATCYFLLANKIGQRGRNFADELRSLNSWFWVNQKRVYPGLELISQKPFREGWGPPWGEKVSLQAGWSEQSCWGSPGEMLSSLVFQKRLFLLVFLPPSSPSSQSSFLDMS